MKRLTKGILRGIDGLWITFPPESQVEVADISPGHFSNWSLFDEAEHNNFHVNITLKNTRINSNKVVELKLLNEGHAVFHNLSGIQLARAGWQG